MKLLTLCTRVDGWFLALKESARRNGYELVVLGWGQRWTGFSMKPRLVAEYLAAQRDDRAALSRRKGSRRRCRGGRRGRRLRRHHA